MNFGIKLFIVLGILQNLVFLCGIILWKMILLLIILSLEQLVLILVERSH